MAEQLRNLNELLALRIRLEPGRSESRVAIDFYRGHEQRRDRLWMPAEAFGIPPALTYREVEARWHRLFPDQLDAPAGLAEFGEALGGLIDELSPQEPLWLQISHGSNYLATVPWETVIRSLTDRALPIFRIPNFLIDPHYPTDAPRIAICASSPSAKVSYLSGEVVVRMVETLTGALPSADLHLFVDAQGQADIAELARVDHPVRVTVHDPQGAEQFGLGGTVLRDVTGGLSSPWLQWMENELGSQRTDLVHFVSPGYFTPDLGGLALAHSPLGDVQRRKAHFVSATEINLFLNAVGAWAVGCTIPVKDSWSVGVRIFAEQLARQRPEPIVLHEANSPESPDDRYAGLEAAYRFLLGPPQDEAPSTPGVGLYAHPKRLGGLTDADHEPIASISQSEYAYDLEAMPPADFAPIFKKAARSERTLADEARWQATVRLNVEQSFSKLATGGIVTPEEQGEAQALEFLIRALEEEEGG